MWGVPVLFKIIFFNWGLVVATFQTGEVIPATFPSYCANGEYFHTVQLRCLPCEKDLHLIPSRDGFTCICDDRSKVVSWNASFPVCIPCKVNEVPTWDQRDCITCPIENIVSSESDSVLCENFLCPANSLSMDRAANGTVFNRIKCIQCPKDTHPSADGRECEACPSRKEICCTEGFCPSIQELDWPTDDTSFTVTYLNGRKIVSTYLKENLRKAVFLCKVSKHWKSRCLSTKCAGGFWIDQQNIF